MHARHDLDALAWVPVPGDQPTSLGYFMRDYVAHLRHQRVPAYFGCATGTRPGKT